jgi:hypothetical protein
MITKTSSRNKNNKYHIHDVEYRSLRSMFPNQYNYIRFPELTFDTTHKITMIRTDIQYYYGETDVLHKQLDIISIPDLRNIITDYLLFDKIDFLIRINEPHISSNKYVMNVIRIKHNGILYIFRYNMCHRNVMLRMVEPGDIDTKYCSGCHQVGYVFVNDYKIEHVINILKNRIRNVDNPVYTALIIFDTIFNQFELICHSKKLKCNIC